MGVHLLQWIIASRLGRWPSLAPEKQSLQKHQTDHQFHSLGREATEGALQKVTKLTWTR